MASLRDSPSPAPVPRNIEEKLGDFKSQVLLMILSYVNGNFQNTAPSLMEHLIKLERDSDSYSGIINYTFKRLKVDHSFTPDHDTVELPLEKAKGIELRLALVDFFLSLGGQQAGSRAIKNIAEGLSLPVQEMTPLEIIEEVCKRRSFEDVLRISNSVATEFNHAMFFNKLHGDTDWLHNRNDVTKFLIKESGFSSPSQEMSLFMTHKLSTIDFIIISIKVKLRSICQKYRKRVGFCIFLLVTVSLVLPSIVLGISYHRSNSADQSMEIGDVQNSSALISVPGDVSSVSLNITSKVRVFMASSIPLNGTRVIQSRIPPGRGRCVIYNVNTGNLPVYLLPGSIMNYTLTVSGLHDSKCPAHLVLLNNENTCNYNSSNVVKAYCLTNGTMNVLIMINESVNYYVVLVKENRTVSVSSDITVHQVYYNTSHLSPAKDCEHKSNDASSCTVHNPDIKKWSCSNTEWYVILQSSPNVNVGYYYKTPSFDYCRLTVALICTLVVIAIVLILAITGCCLVIQRKKIFKKCRRNGPIQDNLALSASYNAIFVTKN